MFRFYPQCSDRNMTGLCSQCNIKVFRPEECIVSNGGPCDACAKDIELEKEIKKLELEIQKINSMRRRLRTAMNANHDPFIHKFPFEIVSHIFIQCAPPSACFDKGDRASALYLGAVCQKWRQLAWATSGLWNSLYFKISKHWPEQCEKEKYLPQLVAEWLERSSGRPLTIRFEDRSGWPDLYEEYRQEIINTLNKHSASWQDMQFGLQAHDLHRLCGSSQEIYSVDSFSLTPTIRSNLPAFQRSA